MYFETDESWNITMLRLKSEDITPWIITVVASLYIDGNLYIGTFLFKERIIFYPHLYICLPFF